MTEIDSAESQEELTRKESMWIRYYDSVNTGYNETDAEYKCGGNTYKSKTEEEMNVIRNKIRLTKLGGKNPHARAVKAIDITTGEEKIYPSQEECAKDLKINGHQPISRRCLGKIKSPLNGKYKFEYYNK